MARVVFTGPIPPQPPDLPPRTSIGEGLSAISESLLERRKREREELVRQEQTRVSQFGLDARLDINPFQDFTPTGPRGRGDPSGAQSFVRGERGTQKDKFLSALRESGIQPSPELQPLITQILEGLQGPPEVGPIVQLEPTKEAVQQIGDELVTVREAVPVTPKPKVSDLLDERGAIKSKVTAELRKQTAIVLGGFFNEELGEIGGLELADRDRFSQIQTEAERLIREGTAKGIGEAVEKAVRNLTAGPGVEPLEGDPKRVPLSQETRDELNAQSANLRKTIALALKQLPAVEDATGVLSNLAVAVDATLGQLLQAIGGEDPIFFADIQSARGTMRTVNKIIETGFINNPRYPEGERGEAKELLPKPDEWAGNPATALVDFRNVIQIMRDILEINETQVAGGIPDLGITKKPIIDLDTVTIDELIAFVGSITEEELDAMSEEDRAKIFLKLEGRKE